jgi:DNA replication protein DnaC
MSAATVVVDETLQLRLKATHLPSFLAHHVELAHRTAAEGWSHVRYLVELVVLEASERSDRRMTRLLRDAKLPRDMPLTLRSARYHD